jgi:hypothetical protein
LIATDGNGIRRLAVRCENDINKMVHFADSDNEDSFVRLENKAGEIRKKLLGVLLLAKNIWKDELVHRPGGIEIIETGEKAEETFVNSSLTDPRERLEDVLNVIHARVNGIFELMEYISKIKQQKK